GTRVFIGCVEVAPVGAEGELLRVRARWMSRDHRALTDGDRRDCITIPFGSWSIVAQCNEDEGTIGAQVNSAGPRPDGDPRYFPATVEVDHRDVARTLVAYEGVRVPGERYDLPGRRHGSRFLRLSTRQGGAVGQV